MVNVQFIRTTALLLLVGIGVAWWSPVTALASADDEVFVYLPVVLIPPLEPVGDNLLVNPSFEAGWTNLPPAPGNLINQQPNGWTLRWVEPGEPIFDSTDIADGVPECIHKLTGQLPPDEQPGGPNALILDGDATYKIFHFDAPFGAELSQTITGLSPGAQLRLTVPVQIHLHDDTADPYTAESGVWANGEGQWANAEVMGDHTWYEHVVVFTVPDNGEVEILVRVKSKWGGAKDFFMDALQLVALTP